MNGSGCPKCAGTLRITNQIIDERIHNRSFKRIGNCKGNKTKITWQCLVCCHIWLATPSDIVRSKIGCPKCAGNLPLTDEIIDTRLKERAIKRIDHYGVNNRISLQWQCCIKTCQYLWIASPGSVLGGSGCPHPHSHVWTSGI